MGLLDGFKAASLIIKSGIATAKVCEKMDDLILKSRKEHKDSLTAEENELYNKYNEARLQKMDASVDGSSEAREGVEDAMQAAQVAYLSAIVKNAKLPKDFRDEIAAAVKEYQDIMANFETKKNELLGEDS